MSFNVWGPGRENALRQAHRLSFCSAQGWVQENERRGLPGKESESAKVDADELSSQQRLLGVYKAKPIRGLTGDKGRRRMWRWRRQNKKEISCFQ